MCIACLLLLAVGCRRRPPAPAPEGVATPAEVTLRDQVGRLVKLLRPPRRIVSLAPSTTETLFALGVGDRVVGVTTWCDYPPEAQELATVGDSQLNVERIISLDPDLVVAVAHLQGGVIEALDRAGAPVLAIDTSAFDDLYAAIRLLGEATDAREQAETIVAEMQDARRRIREAAVPEEHRPRVFIEIGDRPLRTAGPGTFVSQIVEDAGGRNIADDVRSDWGTFSYEAVIARDPDVIISTIPDDARAAVHPEGWAAISAVRTGRVHVIDPDIVVRPGPRLKQGLEAVFEVLHPRPESAPRRHRSP
ncbi:MAG: ABC transporter substrate-binding protein [Armatimonadota bacterium]|jgi:iron complex transport system substrate-binding protein